jgi:uncharacterized protein DUF4235
MAGKKADVSKDAGKDAGKKADMGSKVVNAVAGMAAAFVMRKALTFAWTKVTGKEPPDSPEDPQVALGEALGWAFVMGAGVATARLLASRLVVHKAGITQGTPPD